MRTRLLLASLLLIGFGESLLAQATYAVADVPTVAEMDGSRATCSPTLRFTRCSGGGGSSGDGGARASW